MATPPPPKKKKKLQKHKNKTKHAIGWKWFQKAQFDSVLYKKNSRDGSRFPQFNHPFFEAKIPFHVPSMAIKQRNSSEKENEQAIG